MVSPEFEPVGFCEDHEAERLEEAMRLWETEHQAEIQEAKMARKKENLAESQDHTIKALQAVLFEGADQ